MQEEDAGRRRIPTNLLDCLEGVTNDLLSSGSGMPANFHPPSRLEAVRDVGIRHALDPAKKATD